MRRLSLALSAVFLSTGLALSAALFVTSESAYSERGSEEIAGQVQYRGEDYSYLESAQNAATTAGIQVERPENDRLTADARRPAQEDSASKVLEQRDSVSQGSVPGTRAPASALSIMEPPSPYSQVVDNASPRRFSARGWKASSGRATHYGKDYSYVRPESDVAPARFRAKIPATDYYTVYARWPAAKGNNAATRFGTSTTSGIRWTKANQRRDGGMWVRLGAYEMEAGNQYAVRVSGRSKGKGRVVADAIMVVRGTQMAPPQGDKAKDAASKRAPGDLTIAGGDQGTSLEVIRRARSHIGTPYRHSPPLACEAYHSEDCSCFTSLVFSKWLSLPDDPVGQWEAGQPVAESELRPGDLVFFKEGGSSFITHVAIYSGRGNIIHASSYWGRVVESPMRYVSGYYGAKRLT
jgi:cell wall-associated NlpC family hydrolase